MVRTGLYPSEVKRARDDLVARGVYPSVDAVRIELGNTGSKSTIHRFLKELQEEEGGAKPTPPIREALQGLVAQLADELHREADEKAATAAERCAEKEARFRDAELALTRELEESKKRVQDLEARLAAEVHSHTITREVLQEHVAARRTAEQRVLDLQDRLAENDAHLQSLEDKHSHARQALEHYRQASSETRQQDQRRHEHQVQQLQADLRQSHQTIAVRQADITRLNQEGATLVAELSHAKMAAYNAERLLNQQETKLEQIPVLGVNWPFTGF